MRHCTRSATILARSILAVCVLCMLPLALSAQISLSGTGPGGALVTTRDNPYLSIAVRATSNGQPFLLTTDNVVVIENNTSVVPDRVLPPDNGVQVVQWRYANHRISPAEIIPRLLVFDGNSVAEASTSNITGSYTPPFVLFQDTRDNRIREISFGTVAPGSQKTATVVVKALSGIKLDDGEELSVPIDSIAVLEGDFTADWKGNYLSTQKPPVSIISPFRYNVDVTFAPSGTDYSRGILRVYYDGGLYADLVLRGNTAPIPDVPGLRLVSPNGGERLAPCEEVTVQWTGHLPGVPTTVEYSANGGASWSTIGKSNDSTLVWRVPGEHSDSVLLRVSQQLTQSEVKQLDGPSFGVHALAFSSNGSRLAAGYADGSVVEWNVGSATAAATYQLPQTDPGGNTPALGIGYTADGAIVAAFRSTPRDVTLAFFRNGTPTPVALLSLPFSFAVRSMAVSPDGATLLFVPEQGAQIVVHSAADGSFQRTIDLPAPVAAIAFSSGTGMLGAALLDNTVRLLSPPNYALTGTVQLDRSMPMAVQLALARDHSYIALAGRVSTGTLTSAVESEIHVIETATGEVIRTLRNASASNSVGMSFSQTARFLAIGMEGVPQIGLWNLIQDSFSSLGGQPGTLTDIQFSSVGTNLATSSVDPGDNVRLRGFAFPESDRSDNFLRIRRQTVAAVTPSLPPTFIGTAFDSVLTQSFCNNGDVPIFLTGVRLENGVHYRLLTPFAPDTLQPGDCLSFEIEFAPLDTGTIADRLIYSTCSTEFALPLSATGLNRTIALPADDQMFGEICVGDEMEREIVVLRNDDPIPLTINGIEVDDAPNAPFAILNPPGDTTLQPGETLSLRIRFRPTQRGVDRRLFRILHSGQTNVVRMLYLNGRGLGAEITVDQNDLRFIPEESARTLILTNASDIPVTVDSVRISPSGAFSVTTPLPVVIPAGGQVELTVEWNRTETDDATLSTFFTPCAVAQETTLGLYRAVSTLSMPVVEADPRGEASIPIRFTTVENMPYNGTRVFETEFTVHSGLFLPKTVVSEFGEATLMRNDVVGDRRIIGVRVEGEFPEEGIVAVVTGLAGLADVTTSTLEFDTDPLPWGEAVQAVYQTGEFRLAGVCGDRRLLTAEQALIVRSVYPNPAQVSVTVEFDALAAGSCTLRVVDALGLAVGAPVTVTASEGRNSAQLTLPSVADGSYRLIVQQGTAVTSAALTIRR